MAFSASGSARFFFGELPSRRVRCTDRLRCIDRNGLHSGPYRKRRSRRTRGRCARITPAGAGECIGSDENLTLDQSQGRRRAKTDTRKPSVFRARRCPPSALARTRLSRSSRAQVSPTGARPAWRGSVGRARRSWRVRRCGRNQSVWRRHKAAGGRAPGLAERRTPCPSVPTGALVRTNCTVRAVHKDRRRARY